VANVVSVNVVTMPAINVTAAGGLTNAELRASAVSVAVTTMPALSISSVSISNFPATQPISGTVTANVTNSVTIGAILSSQTGQNILGSSGVFSTLRIRDNAGTYGEPQGSGTLTYNLPVYGTVTVGNSVTIGSLPAISGTVTANVQSSQFNPVYSYLVDPNNDEVFATDYPLPISGAVTANINDPTNVLFANQIGDALFGSDTLLSTLTDLPISGTVTAAAPNGSLTTRFGTPTTANTAFATSAVTNTSRKYLLIQNVTTGSNVITVGIGFTPTTTQGIQLTAGAGITFESSYIPTGAVMILSSVTASNFTVLEA
jgi:hypothetical protein